MTDPVPAPQPQQDTTRLAIKVVGFSCLGILAVLGLVFLFLIAVALVTT